jgi:RNA polymerase sigma-70 factor, ECF subfamily
MIRRRRDPFADIESLIRDVYAYTAYRVANNSDVEEITSRVLERAVRYRDTYDASKGTPISWLIGIARTQIAEERTRHVVHAELDAANTVDGVDLEQTSIERLSLHDAVRSLDDRSRELIALRYGIGLSPRDIAADLGLEENAVNVALHRARERLRAILDRGR